MHFIYVIYIQHSKIPRIFFVFFIIAVIIQNDFKTTQLNELKSKKPNRKT